MNVQPFNHPSSLYILPDLAFGDVVSTVQNFIGDPVDGDIQGAAVSVQNCFESDAFSYRSDNDQVQLRLPSSSGAKEYTRAEFTGVMQKGFSRWLEDIALQPRLRDVAGKEKLNDTSLPDIVSAGLLTMESVEMYNEALLADTPWNRFIDPQPQERTQGGYLRLGSEVIVAGMATSAIEVFANTTRVLARLPRAMAKGYETAFHSPRITPTLKVLIAAGIPGVAVAVPPSVMITSGMLGWYRGMFAREYGIMGAIGFGMNDVTRFWKASGVRNIDALSVAAMRRLPDRQEPIGVREAAKMLGRESKGLGREAAAGARMVKTEAVKLGRGVIGEVRVLGREAMKLRGEIRALKRQARGLLRLGYELWPL